MKKFEQIELNDKGRKNLELSNDVTALPVQLNATIIPEDEKRKEKAKKFGVKFIYKKIFKFFNVFFSFQI